MNFESQESNRRQKRVIQVPNQFRDLLSARSPNSTRSDESSAADNHGVTVWDFAEASGDLLFQMDRSSGEMTFSPNARSLFGSNINSCSEFLTFVSDEDQAELEKAIASDRQHHQQHITLQAKIGNQEQTGLPALLRFFPCPRKAQERLSVGQLAILDPQSFVSRKPAAPEERSHALSDFESDLLQSIVDNAPIAIWYQTSDGDFPIVNRYLASRTAWHTPYTSLTQEELDEASRNTNSALERDGVLRTDETFTYIDGRQRNFKVVRSKVCSADGTPIGAIGLGMDTTDEDRYYQELTQAKIAGELLNQKVSDAAESVERYEQIAKCAQNAKSSFLATISHEMRTPLNAIMGMGALLSESGLDCEQSDFLSTIQSSSDDLLSIINDILDYTNLETSKVELDSEPLEIRECIEDAIQSVATKASDKNLLLSYWVDPDAPETIAGDYDKLRCCLQKLLDNAIKFTDRGEAHLHCSATRLLDGQFELNFEIEDTGIGIDEARTNLLFESFSQVDATSTRRYGGTGLGLAICKRLSDLMRGEIKVTSELGKGSVFSLSIQTHGISNQFGILSASQSINGKTVLIADEAPRTRKILNSYLEHWGAIPTIATNDSGTAAYLAQKDHFDIICISESIARSLNLDPSKTAAPISVLINETGPFRSEENWSCSIEAPIYGASLKERIEDAIQNPSAEPEPPAIEEDNRTVAERYPLSILLAEDNRINQKVTTLTLENFGYQVTIARNGKLAYEAVQSKDFDLILMDIQMPEMDGLEATQAIRDMTTLSCQPYIVAVTANALPEGREFAFSSGMNDYIAKPIGKAALLKKIVDAWEFKHPDEDL